MYRTALLAALAVCAHGGSVQGVALEHVSGRPLARTMIRLEPVARPDAPPAAPLTTRAGRAGYFVFPAVPPGIYLVTGEREGFFPAAYGQRLPTGRGTPITVTADSSFHAELRLRHKGAITGRVLDENGVGRPGTTVIAYHARLPLRSAGSGTADDRGVYRIHGLAPGKYWIRSASQTLEDGSGWLPTYGPQGREVRDARVHRVTVDADTTDADVSPDPGSLFRIGGRVVCDTPGPVTVVLSSETGRRQAQSGCNGLYSFDELAPAYYEIFARVQDGTAAGFIEVYVGGNHLGHNIAVQRLPVVDVEVRRARVTGGDARLNVPVKLYGRRQDLSETGEVRRIEGARVSLEPGNWEFRAEVPEEYYVETIGTPYPTQRFRKQERSTEWFEASIEPWRSTRLWVTLSDATAAVAGMVRAGSRAAPGVPVFLWPVEEQARRITGGPRQTLTDTEGRFRFGSLPPGDYRVLASFDIHEIDEDLVELSGAQAVRTQASQTAAVELAIWQAP